MKTTILLTLVLISLNTIAQTPSYVPSNGLVGWWPFNGNAIDESGNLNNGSVNNATLTQDRNGNINSAYSFNGNDTYIEVPSNSNLELSNNYSVNGWFQANIFFNTATSDRSIISKVQSNGWNDGYEVIVGGTTNSIAHVGNVGGNNFNLSSTGYLLNTWYMFTITYNGSIMNLFMDGVLVNSQATSGNLQTGSLPLRFGMRDGSIQYFNGDLDDIGIWNRALSYCEIQDLYNSQLGSANTFSSQSQTSVDTYTWPVNNQTYTQSGIYVDTLINAAGCDSLITLNLSLEYTGLDEQNQVNVLVSPNPISNDFSISGIEQIVSLSLKDVSGKLIKTFDVQEKNYSISNLTSGVYFLEVSDEKRTYMIKVMKK